MDAERLGQECNTENGDDGKNVSPCHGVQQSLRYVEQESFPSLETQLYVLGYEQSGTCRSDRRVERLVDY